MHVTVFLQAACQLSLYRAVISLYIFRTIQQALLCKHMFTRYLREWRTFLFLCITTMLNKMNVPLPSGL